MSAVDPRSRSSDFPLSDEEKRRRIQIYVRQDPFLERLNTQAWKDQLFAVRALKSDVEQNHKWAERVAIKIRHHKDVVLPNQIHKLERISRILAIFQAVISLGAPLAFIFLPMPQYLWIPIGIAFPLGIGLVFARICLDIKVKNRRQEGNFLLSQESFFQNHSLKSIQIFGESNLQDRGHFASVTCANGFSKRKAPQISEHALEVLKKYGLEENDPHLKTLLAAHFAAHALPQFDKHNPYGNPIDRENATHRVDAFQAANPDGCAARLLNRYKHLLHLRWDLNLGSALTIQDLEDQASQLGIDSHYFAETKHPYQELIAKICQEIAFLEKFLGGSFSEVEFAHRFENLIIEGLHRWVSLKPSMRKLAKIQDQPIYVLIEGRNIQYVECNEQTWNTFGFPSTLEIIHRHQKNLIALIGNQPQPHIDALKKVFQEESIKSRYALSKTTLQLLEAVARHDPENYRRPIQEIYYDLYLICKHAMEKEGIVIDFEAWSDMLEFEKWLESHPDMRGSTLENVHRTNQRIWDSIEEYKNELSEDIEKPFIEGTLSLPEIMLRLRHFEKKRIPHYKKMRSAAGSFGILQTLARKITHTMPLVPFKRVELPRKLSRELLVHKTSISEAIKAMPDYLFADSTPIVEKHEVTAHLAPQRLQEAFSKRATTQKEADAIHQEIDELQRLLDNLNHLQDSTGAEISLAERSRRVEELRTQRAMKKCDAKIIKNKNVRGLIFEFGIHLIYLAALLVISCYAFSWSNWLYWGLGGLSIIRSGAAFFMERRVKHLQNNLLQQRYRRANRENDLIVHAGGNSRFKELAHVQTVYELDGVHASKDRIQAHQIYDGEETHWRSLIKEQAKIVRNIGGEEPKKSPKYQKKIQSLQRLAYKPPPITDTYPEALAVHTSKQLESNRSRLLQCLLESQFLEGEACAWKRHKALEIFYALAQSSPDALHAIDREFKVPGANWNTVLDKMISHYASTYFTPVEGCLYTANTLIQKAKLAASSTEHSKTMGMALYYALFHPEVLGFCLQPSELNVDISQAMRWKQREEVSNHANGLDGLTPAQYAVFDQKMGEAMIRALKRQDFKNILNVKDNSLPCHEKLMDLCMRFERHVAECLENYAISNSLEAFACWDAKERLDLETLYANSSPDTQQDIYEYLPHAFKLQIAEKMEEKALKDILFSPDASNQYAEIEEIYDQVSLKTRKALYAYLPEFLRLKHYQLTFKIIENIEQATHRTFVRYERDLDHTLKNAMRELCYLYRNTEDTHFSTWQHSMLMRNCLQMLSIQDKNSLILHLPDALKIEMKLGLV